MRSILKLIHKINSKIISEGELRKMFIVLQYLVLVYILLDGYLEENLYFYL